ncbi:three-prime repair exonuclease 1 [Pieris rapae]|uniref:three-prime repair exonuclease 1 n=1 Tax=Pieris rapae TaxID=64459 RepID=UPI000B92A7AA|nr:three-prime repair exonuclease 1 [Pieris rapae]XP_022116302.1 three-prime repair exonuclease 1 [Pieris rapae]
MKIETFVFFDIEATGLPHLEKNRTKITELTFIAVARKDIETCECLSIMNKLSLLFNPERKIQKEASKITGLTNNNLKNQPIFKDKIQTINTFLLELSQPVCLVAHNGNRFDFKVLRAEFCEAGLDLPSHLLCLDSLTGFRKIAKDSMNIYSNVSSSSSKNSTRKTNNTQETNISSLKVDDLLTDDDDDDWPQLNTSTEIWEKIDELSFNECPVKKPKTTEIVSCQLTALYKRFLKKEPLTTHRAEADCIMLLECVTKTKQSFLPWADKNCKLISEIKPLIRS